MINSKLTKKFFMNLPEGLFLVSNIFPTMETSVFAKETSPFSQRLDQWKRIISVGADQRLCHVFGSKEEYEIWLNQAMKQQLNPVIH
jgi:hypothetical protein